MNYIHIDDVHMQCEWERKVDRQGEDLILFGAKPKSNPKGLLKPDSDSERWMKAMKSEMESMYQNKVLTLVGPLEGVKPIGCKWVFKKKTDMDGNKYIAGKARSFAGDNGIFAGKDDGDLVTSHEEISGLAISYFSNLIGTDSASTEILDPSISLLRLTDSQQLFFTRDFLQEDILATLKGMAKNKSPGPDGFTPEFYIAAWGVVGPAVTKAILLFFESLMLPRTVSSVAITLIPKLENASKLEQFRPISCWDSASISILTSSILRFSVVSRLHPNAEKSECFFYNIPQDMIQETISSTGFLRGILPIKYLGLPLITSRLRAQDCAGLILRLYSRIDSWHTSFLRFSGKLQLLRSVLVAKPPSCCSWAFGQIMKLRDEAGRFITFKVGAASELLMWHDPWVNNSSLISRLGNRIVSISESTSLARVKMFISDGRWIPPRSNHVQAIALHYLLSSIPIERKDSVLWNGYTQVRISTIWDSIRRRGTPPPWIGAIWHPLSIPKCAFFMLLALKSRLLTKDRMDSFGMNVDTTCVLCGCNTETTEHLFTLCPYASLIFRNSPVSISLCRAD
ncbi:hypothetical protein AgCh_010043 [Apium graveolens]